MIKQVQNDTQERTIMLHAKCVYCPAPGMYAAVKGEDTVTFCAHCAREHEAGLVAKHFTLVPRSPQFRTV